MGSDCSSGCCGNSKQEHYRKRPMLINRPTDTNTNPENKERIDSVNCISIDHCLCIQRMIAALHYYEKWNGDNYKHDLVEYCEQTYEQFMVDDYNHILIHHECDIELLHNYIKTNFESLLSCDINTCKMYQRYNRDREKYSKWNDINDQNIMFYRDLLDQMHYYLLHIFETGLRITKDDIQKHFTDVNKAVNEEDYKCDEKLQDDYYICIQRCVQQKRTKLLDIEIEFNRFEKQTKFKLFSDLYSNHNINDNDSKIQEVDIDEKESKLENNSCKQTQVASCFSIGYTFYYWNYYYSTDDGSNQPWYNENDHLGYCPG
eukprot:217611_1